MRAFRQMRKDFKHLIIQARQEYFRVKIEKLKDKTQIWRLLERKGLTASKSIMSTHVFSVSELELHETRRSRDVNDLVSNSKNLVD